MALNSDQAVRRATNRLLDIVAREQATQAKYIEQLIQERNAALEEARKAKEELKAYKHQVQRYQSEADTAKQQLAKTHARFSLTLVPVNDNPATAEKHPRSSHTPSGGKTPNTDQTSRTKRKRKPADPPPTATTSAAATQDVSLSRNPVSMPSDRNGTNHQTVVSMPPDRNGTNHQPHYTPFHPTAQTPTRRSSDTPQGWCYCGMQEYGTMVMCSNQSCPKRWFHVPCTGLAQVPEGEWQCKICDPNRAQPFTSLFK